MCTIYLWYMCVRTCMSCNVILCNVHVMYVEERSLKENQPLQARGIVCETQAL
jgi:hypothetical protein